MPTAAVTLLEWTPEFAVHVPEIDREHQFLFGIVNHLHEAMLAGQGAETLGTFLAELAKYTIYHFANEEKTMVAAHYPEMLAHVEQHEGLRRRVSEVKVRFERGEIALTIELMLFLSDWLRNHVTVTDRRLGNYIQVEQSFTAYLDKARSPGPAHRKHIRAYGATVRGG
jgi:hemerythrin